MADAIIIGAGPAGATAARLLAQWGHSVVLLTAPPAPEHALAECLPPSTRKVLRFLGIADAVDRAGFYRTLGNTVWWSGEKRVEPYPDGYGYQVPRARFDALLADLARAAGVEIRTGKIFARPADPVPQVRFDGDPVAARFVVDCSGRAGVLARHYRVRHAGPRTVAMCAVWRDDQYWRLPDPTHTLVESYPGGWAWSVPIAPDTRYVAFMTRARRDYHGELSKTAAFRDIFARGEIVTPPWGRDASIYSATQFAGPAFLLAGDAAATIDPLSSFGVKKALVSGWTAAIVANTCLLRPAMQNAALAFHDRREREVFETYARLSATWYADESAAPPETLRALEDLRASPSIALRIAPGLTVEPVPAIEGNEIVFREGLGGHDFIANVNVPKLAVLAERHTQVPDLYQAYLVQCAPADLRDFLTALATMIAKRIVLSV